MGVPEQKLGSKPWMVQHALRPADATAMAAVRTLVEPHKGQMQGVASRGAFDSIMEQVAAPAAVQYSADEVGGIAGWWSRPDNASRHNAVLHLHGGWFNWGSAHTYRHLTGHIAAATATAVFTPDYRLAPEHPFPAAVNDVRAALRGLVNQGHSRIAVTGDSAGGNLALALLGMDLTNELLPAAIVGGIALSPVTDLTLSGETWISKAVADPYFTRPQIFSLVRSYLQSHDAGDALASPLFSELRTLRPVRIHVGSDEVLLDDSVRFVENAVAAGLDAQLDVWEGMVHGFLGGVGRLEAADEALTLIGRFLSDRLNS